MDNSEDVDSANSFSILIASDIHLGYAEKDPLRGDDSFNTFEEILQLAEKRQVDLILLGGDLFHDNKPSPSCLHRCLTLLRRYCMGDRPVAVEFLSDQSENFQHCYYPSVNYEDPNLNISIPVFSIHGNHDDPSGYGRVASLDLLSASGLINYFGKWTDLTQVQISPLLMQKGATRLAIYGLSHIKDERLSRLFRDRRVTMLRPKEFEDEWFSIFVLHQNRAVRGMTNYIKEDVLDKFLDLVIWGHEHECLITPEKNANDVYIMQPGSPVATSLCEGEAVEKCVAIIEVFKKEFKSEPIKLKTVRPFVIESVNLSKCNLNRKGGVIAEEVQAYLTERVEDMIRRSQDQLTGHRKQPTLPLIRLRVEYSENMAYFNPIRFGQRFNERVANPTDLILLKREKKTRTTTDTAVLDEDAMQHALENGGDDTDRWGIRAELVVERYFAEGDNKQLKVLSVRGLAEGVKRFIDKSDDDAITNIVMHQVNKTIKHIQEKKIIADDDTIIEEMDSFRLQRLQMPEDETKEAESVLESCALENRRNGQSAISSNSDSDVDIASTSTSGRGRGRGGRRGRGKAPASPASTPARGRGSQGGRGSRGKRGAGLKNIKEALSVTKTPTQSKKTVVYLSDSD